MSTQLSEREARWLQRLRRRQPFAIAVACVLIAAGFGYGLWAGQRFKLGVSQSAHQKPLLKVIDKLCSQTP